MKEFDFPLDKFQIERLTMPIRTKRDVMLVWMNALKIISVYVEPHESQQIGMLSLRVAKMSRIFVLSPAGSFSMSLPFSVKEDEGKIIFGSPFYPEIDNFATSSIIALLTSFDVLNAVSPEAFFDPVADLSEHHNFIWQLLLELMIADDGYLRVDHDPKRKNGLLHPLNHIDVFYSQRTTFKVGLERKHELDEFIDLLDVKTDCRFLAG